MSENPPTSLSLDAKTVLTQLRIGALIVTFFPNRVALASLQAALCQSVSHVCIINNSPTPFSRSEHLENTSQLTIIEMGENRGIAYAQNIGLRYLFDLGCEAVFLFDQDSTINPAFVANMLTAWRTLEQQGPMTIAAIGPAYVDRKTGIGAFAISYQPSGVIKRTPLRLQTQAVEADYVIASGSLIPRYAWLRIGPLAEPLFAYWLDIEWGLRAKKFGLKSYLIPTVTMEHSIGEKTIMVFGRPRIVHDDFRQYFLIRNPLLLLRYSHLPKMMRLRAVIEVFFKYCPWYLLSSTNKKKTWQTLCQAITDGLYNRGGRR